MAQVKGALLTAALLTGLLAACSRSEPPPGGAVLTDPPAAANGSKVHEMREATAKACREETRRKGLKSVAAIFSRLRPGKTDDEFNACMRARGYEVAQ